MREFILRPNVIIGFNNVNYDLHDNEVILLESLINKEYFSQMREKKNYGNN